MEGKTVFITIIKNFERTSSPNLTRVLELICSFRGRSVPCSRVRPTAWSGHRIDLREIALIQAVVTGRSVWIILQSLM